MTEISENRSPVCLLDWDGTLRKGFVIADWLQYLSETGVIDKEFRAEMSTAFDEYRQGTVAYEELARRVIEIYGKAICGKPAASLIDLANNFCSSDDNLFEFSIELIDLIRECGIVPIVISGSPSIIVKRLAGRIGISECVALDMNTDDSGIFDGEVVFNTAVSTGKQKIVADIISKRSCVAISFGDSLSDEPLFRVSDVAYCVVDKHQIRAVKRSLATMVKSGDLRLITREYLGELVGTGKPFWNSLNRVR